MTNSVEALVMSRQYNLYCQAYVLGWGGLIKPQAEWTNEDLVAVAIAVSDLNTETSLKNQEELQAAIEEALTGDIEWITDDDDIEEDESTEIVGGFTPDANPESAT